jgi:hypothetical protein
VNRSFALPVYVLVLLPAVVFADSRFAGTWKGDLSTAKISGQPEVFLLQDGIYTCKTCTPQVKVPADGEDHSVSGVPYYDVLNVATLDERTILQTGKKAGKTMFTNRFSVSADGSSANADFMDASATNGAPVTGTIVWQRAANGPPGSHAISGSWREGPAKVSDNGVTITLSVTNNKLSMTSPTGGAYVARLDGTEAAYTGDPGLTTVSVRKIDEHSFEEIDKHDGKPVEVWVWQFDPDGKTAHVRLTDATNGNVTEMLARKQ